MTKKFFNADRSRSATIDYDHDGIYDPSYFFAECLRASCEVFLTSKHLTRFFDVEENDDEREIKQAIEKARRIGDRVFFIEVYEHSAFAVRIKTLYQPLCEFDSSFAGVIIAHAENWKEHLSPIFTTAFVVGVMDDLAEQAEAWLNGTIYEFFMQEDGCSCSYGPYLSEEEAEKGLHAEFPELVFTDDDFECTCTYSLKPEARARINDPA